MTTTITKKILAFILGWIGAGIVWGIWTGIFGDTSHENLLLMLVQLFVFIYVWMKIYSFFTKKWAVKQEKIKSNDIHVSNSMNIDSTKKFFCPQCGVDCGSVVKFCPKCGYKIND
jgi:hypothetical protein